MIILVGEPRHYNELELNMAIAGEDLIYIHNYTLYKHLRAYDNVVDQAFLPDDKNVFYNNIFEPLSDILVIIPNGELNKWKRRLSNKYSILEVKHAKD